jgi:hypothetical protein
MHPGCLFLWPIFLFRLAARVYKRKAMAAVPSGAWDGTSVLKRRRTWVSGRRQGEKPT